MYILALETANEQCSVAIHQDRQNIFFQQHQEPRAQTQQILPMIEQAMTQTQLAWQDISLIAFSRGPGAFSGVRINTAVAQALAWAHDLPVVAVSTLQALAQRAYRQYALAQVTAVIDARMNEVYIANFQLQSEQHIMQMITQPAFAEEKLLDYSSALQYAQFCCVGSGTSLLTTDDHHSHDADLDYHALQATALDIADIAYVKYLQGQTVDAEHALPVYLRDNAWKKIAEQKRG